MGVAGNILLVGMDIDLPMALGGQPVRARPAVTERMIQHSGGQLTRLLSRFTPVPGRRMGGQSGGNLIVGGDELRAGFLVEFVVF